MSKYARCVSCYQLKRWNRISPICDDCEKVIIPDGFPKPIPDDISKEDAERLEDR